ncbi:hypothetical protein FSP39_004325 [Pinctada imbricata]|uniref:Uncharacterized protein n=1 Tax=Pinctada imbricata TaxID=66713 RepID=A0AA88XHK3_PINIB|nr:hypothetical protein FSP39_004325 [Pinctada imbricata]
MVGDTHKKLGIFGSNTPRLNDGINGGPLILFNENGTSLVISPLNNFMASSMWHNNSPGGTVSWGIMGGVKEVPLKYTLRTLILAGNGINKAMKLYGETLRSFYKNESEARIKYQQSDITNNYLGYWTDNGAYYYYNTETRTSYESTFEEVQKYSMLEKIPYKYVQLDSWWYYKGHDAAVKNWTARTDIFPKGIKYLQEKTKWPIAAHNRYWSTDTDYAKKNGGKYNFIVESMTSLPDDQQFWIDLLTDAKKWGLILYEQDWLNVQVLHLSALQEDISLGTRWLTQMGTAAEQLGLTIQYCMSLPRHALQSLTIPTVTQARVSNDYHPGNEQWRIGISSMFAHALGLAPFKDTFWTTKTQPGNPRYGVSDEPNHRLEIAVATLSAGPIGPGDKVNHTDVEFLKRCCDTDGTILKGTSPATAIDRQIIKMAIPSADGPKGEVWTTVIDVQSRSTFVNRSVGILFAADLQEPFTIKWEDMEFPDSLRDSIIFPLDRPDLWQPFNGSFTLSNCSKTDFCIYYLVSEEPGMNGTQIALLGELDKLIPFSPKRITDIVHAEIDLNVKVRGKPGEEVTLSFLVQRQEIVHTTCILDEDGTAQIMSNRCFS